MRLWHLIFIMGHSEASTRQLWTFCLHSLPFCSKWMKATEELLKHSPTNYQETKRPGLGEIGNFKQLESKLLCRNSFVYLFIWVWLGYESQLWGSYEAMKATKINCVCSVQMIVMIFSFG